MKKYNVLLACDVCMYKSVEVEAESAEEAEQKVSENFEEYDDDEPYEVDYDTMGDFRVVEEAAYEIGVVNEG